MVAKRRLLWVSDCSAPANVRSALEGRFDLQTYQNDEPLTDQLNDSRLAVVYPNGSSSEPRKLLALLGALEHSSAVAVLMLPRSAGVAWAAANRRRGQFICMPDDVSPDVLAAHIEAAEAIQPAVAFLHEELVAARKLVAASETSQDELDEEMHLAARLQRDFLPRRLPEVGPVRFGVMYRPASWLSGDIYDVVRLDERNVGFYVADAVGHGLPAALLTMFIKHALPMKRITGHAYQIMPADVSLSELNADICQQNLSSCQFCTAFYGLLDSQTLMLNYCRAGHPPPVLLRDDGSQETLNAPGALLGVFAEEKFEQRNVQLHPGDRLIIYSDGAEWGLQHATGRSDGPIGEALASLAGVPRDEMLLQLTSWIDSAPPNPSGEEDDITIVVADVAKT